VAALFTVTPQLLYRRGSGVPPFPWTRATRAYRLQSEAAPDQGGFAAF